MKKFLLLMLAVCMTFASFAQFHSKRMIKAEKCLPRTTTGIDLPVTGVQNQNPLVSNKSVMDDPVTCITKYDLQSNYTSQKRVYLHPDGTIGGVATWSQQETSWTDRGSGYNYYDGTSWGSLPTARVETSRVGWGEYMPFDVDGEMIISHQATGPLVINKRTPKGSGPWTQSLMPALPSNITGMFWPRSIVSGANHTFIHIIALTLPTGNGGQTYNGMNGALLYCHSLDGGSTWTDWTQLAGTNGSFYTDYTADTYAWGAPHGDTLVFTVGDTDKDQFIMKSTDNGTTWTKTILWHSLYNLGGTSPGWYNCPDGTMSVALDKQGFAHVAFGLLQDSLAAAGGYWNVYAEGIVYWNEHQPILRQDLNYDSLLATGHLIGWVKDTLLFDQTIIPTANTTTWYVSQTSNPELVIDNDNKVFLTFAAGNSLVDANGYNLRHIYGRDGVITGSGDAILWHNDSLVDLTGDWIQYGFADCMFPSASITSDANIYILFQKDDYAGSYVKSIGNSGMRGQTSASDNSITLLKWTKPIWTGVNEKKAKPTFSVGQNIPNPVSGLTKVNVYLQHAGDLSLKVTSLTGQTLMNMEKPNVQPGVSEFVIDGSQLASGVYFYSVMQGDQKITKKMIVQ
ncbi:MAG: T9SS type A sorting domain-containing protein [Bacteroidetes bacterium]|nr:T9SS type A sorting domain-containing protein [Bacteroidota bacterium]